MAHVNKNHPNRDPHDERIRHPADNRLEEYENDLKKTQGEPGVAEADKGDMQSPQPSDPNNLVKPGEHDNVQQVVTEAGKTEPGSTTTKPA